MAVVAKATVFYKFMGTPMCVGLGNITINHEYCQTNSFAILLQRQYLSHHAILIAPNNNSACYCILSPL